MSKKIIFSVLLLFCLIHSVNAQKWYTDIDTAKKIAIQNDQRIILVFQGSDWCAPCIKLEKEIWESNEFKTYAKDNFVLLKADFPRKNKNRLSKIQQDKNNMLAEKYNPYGSFPKVVVLNKNAEIIGATGYKKLSPSEYISLLNSFN